MLASQYGCRVTAIDLSADYCRVAAELSALVGLQDLIVVQQGNAEALPFEDRSFDVVWTMHVAMNIEDKTRFYDQLARVLRSGGKLAFFDLIAGEGDPYYPVPWADEPSISFLVDESELRLLLSEAGFHVKLWEDVTDEGAAFFAKMNPSSLGLHLILDGMRPKMANLGRSLAEQRVRAVRCICSVD
jgi:SAM-dependent methyltransferase